jgi:hypothetical protein
VAPISAVSICRGVQVEHRTHTDSVFRTPSATTRLLAVSGYGMTSPHHLLTLWQPKVSEGEPLLRRGRPRRAPPRPPPLGRAQPRPRGRRLAGGGRLRLVGQDPVAAAGRGAAARGGDRGHPVADRRRCRDAPLPDRLPLALCGAAGRGDGGRGAGPQASERVDHAGRVVGHQAAQVPEASRASLAHGKGRWNGRAARRGGIGRCHGSAGDEARKQIHSGRRHPGVAHPNGLDR